MPKTFLRFIEDTDFLDVVAEVLVPIAKSSKADIYRNSIDPFSALFDAASQGITISQWLEQEQRRQLQKTLQNRIGRFHQALMGKIAGCSSLADGHIVDIIMAEKKILAEIKNKFNTTKGNHKKSIYDDLAMLLEQPKYAGYTGYYVEIIPSNKKIYNLPFTPPDNSTHSHRPRNERIRIIDGKSFYTLLTGSDTALEAIYHALPEAIGQVLHLEEGIVKALSKDPAREDIFQRAYDNTS